ncbi:MAG: MCE family protein [Nocardioides sp.]|uniref:MCE family protein n=1 Tax=Nocardioides sp. TaxID=35761 RepID=UPI0039E69D9B
MSVTARKPLVLVAVGLVVLLAVLVGARSLSSSGMTVTAYFADSAGLYEGNDVGVLGVKVGTVEKIEPSGSQVKVTLHIDGDQKVPADAGAVIVARSVATDRYVELTPVYHSGATLKDGDKISADKTRTPVEFDEVLATITKFADEIGGNEDTVKAVQQIIESGSAAFDGNGQKLNDTIGSLGGAADTLSGQTEDFTKLLSSLNTLAQQVTANKATEKEFISQVSEASQMLADQREDFRSALRSLDQVVTNVAQFSTDNRDQIVKALSSSTTLMKSLSTKSDQINESLELLPVALNNLERADHNGWLPGRIDPLVLAPLGGQLTQICEALPLNLCETLDGTGTLANLISGLSDLLGIKLGGS